MSQINPKINLVKSCIVNYYDFPRSGVIFRDIFPVLKKPEAFAALSDLLIAECAKHISGVSVICAIECRGFLFGPSLALHFKLPFIPIRKKGKLPGEVFNHTYKMEYGSSTLEIQKDALPRGVRVLLVDDILATGGTLYAGCKLIETLGSEVEGCIVVMEIEELNGRKNLPCPVHPIFTV